MEDCTSISVSPYDSDGNADVKLLREHEKYIQNLVRKKIPRHLIPPDVMDLEVDELIQQVYIKLWLQSQRQHIVNPKAYIRRIVWTETVDMVRRYRPVTSLSVDDDGELYQENIMLMVSEGVQDPADEVEDEEMKVQYIKKIATALLQLSHAEQRAMICSLKDCKDDITLLVLRELKAQGIPIEDIYWPTEKGRKQSLRVALSHGRKKLRLLLKVDACLQSSTCSRNVA